MESFSADPKRGERERERERDTESFEQVPRNSIGNEKI